MRSIRRSPRITSKKVCFLGEIGLAFRQFLPFIEQYHSRLEILTWRTLADVIAVLWPDRFTVIKAEELFPHYSFIETKRIGINNFDPILNAKVKNHRFQHIRYLDKKREFFGRDRYHTLKTKLVYGEQHATKPFVSIFPRKREYASGRNNISFEHVEWLKTKYPDKEIIGHGLPKERIDLGITYCDDVRERINVFNNSEILLTPSSGMASFALACGCNLILTHDTQSPDEEGTNPHNCSIRYWKDII